MLDSKSYQNFLRAFKEHNYEAINAYLEDAEFYKKIEATDREKLKKDMGGDLFDSFGRKYMEGKIDYPLITLFLLQFEEFQGQNTFNIPMSSLYKNERIDSIKILLQSDQDNILWVQRMPWVSLKTASAGGSLHWVIASLINTDRLYDNNLTEIINIARTNNSHGVAALFAEFQAELKKTNSDRMEKTVIIEIIQNWLEKNSLEHVFPHQHFNKISPQNNNGPIVTNTSSISTSGAGINSETTAHTTTTFLIPNQAPQRLVLSPVPISEASRGLPRDALLLSLSTKACTEDSVKQYFSKTKEQVHVELKQNNHEILRTAFNSSIDVKIFQIIIDTYLTFECTIPNIRGLGFGLNDALTRVFDRGQKQQMGNQQPNPPQSALANNTKPNNGIPLASATATSAASSSSMPPRQNPVLLPSSSAPIFKTPLPNNSRPMATSGGLISPSTAGRPVESTASSTTVSSMPGKTPEHLSSSPVPKSEAKNDSSRRRLIWLLSDGACQDKEIADYFSNKNTTAINAELTQNNHEMLRMALKGEVETTLKIILDTYLKHECTIPEISTLNISHDNPLVGLIVSDKKLQMGQGTPREKFMRSLSLKTCTEESAKHYFSNKSKEAINAELTQNNHEIVRTAFNSAIEVKPFQIIIDTYLNCKCIMPTIKVLGFGHNNELTGVFEQGQRQQMSNQQPNFRPGFAGQPLNTQTPNFSGQ